MAPPFVAESLHVGLLSPRADAVVVPAWSYTIECWIEGFTMGALLVLMIIVCCNIKQHVLLHKLILLEHACAIPKAYVIFFTGSANGWASAATGVTIYSSYFLHNLIAYLKIKPFLNRKGSRIFFGTLLLSIPLWCYELYCAFVHFAKLDLPNHWNYIRPLEIIPRDPWWVFTTVYLVHVLQTRYNFGLIALCRSNPRFAILIACMFISIAFSITDAVVSGITLKNPTEAGASWRIGVVLSLVFKLLSDTVFLDNFKIVLDKLVDAALKRAHGPQKTYEYSSSAGGNLSSRNQTRSDHDDSVELQDHKGFSRFRHHHKSAHSSSSRSEPNRVATQARGPGHADRIKRSWRNRKDNEKRSHPAFDDTGAQDELSIVRQTSIKQESSDTQRGAAEEESRSKRSEEIAHATPWPLQRDVEQQPQVEGYR